MKASWTLIWESIHIYTRGYKMRIVPPIMETIRWLVARKLFPGWIINLQAVLRWLMDICYLTGEAIKYLLVSFLVGVSIIKVCFLLHWKQTSSTLNNSLVGNRKTKQAFIVQPSALIRWNTSSYLANGLFIPEANHSTTTHPGKHCMLSQIDCSVLHLVRLSNHLPTFLLSLHHHVLSGGTYLPTPLV